MGWDYMTNKNLNDQPSIDSSKDGFQEYEVEQDIVFTVKYKVLAKDTTDLIDKKLNLESAHIEIDDDNLDNSYDMRVKNWGTENTKENATGKQVVKYKFDEDQDDDDADWEYELE